MLTSSLKLSVLCERLRIRIVISGLLIVNHGFRQSCRLVGMVAPRSLVGCSTNRFFLLVLGLILWKWMNGVHSLGSNQECRIGYKHFHSRVSQCLASIRKLGNRRSSEGLRSFKPSKGTNLFILIILAGDIEINPGPRSQVSAPQYFYTDHSKAVLLLWFLTVLTVCVYTLVHLLC